MVNNGDSTVDNENNGRLSTGKLDHLKKIFVGGLSPQTSGQSLTNYFNNYGLVVDTIVMKELNTNRSRGFGFVTFANEATVDKVQNSRPHFIDNKAVDTKRAQPRGELGKTDGETNLTKEKKIFLGGLKDCHTEDVLKEYFAQFGNVSNVKILFDKTTGRNRGFGFLEFVDAGSVDFAVSQKQHTISFTLVDVKKCIYKPDPLKKMYGQKNGFPGAQMDYGNSDIVGDNFNGSFASQSAFPQSQMPMAYNNSWPNYFQQAQPGFAYNATSYAGGGGWQANAYSAQAYPNNWAQNNYTTTSHHANDQQNFGEYKQAYNGGPQKANSLQNKRVNPYGNSAAPNFGDMYAHTSNTWSALPHAATYHAGHAMSSSSSSSYTHWVH